MKVFTALQFFLDELEANGSSPANVETYRKRLSRVCLTLPKNVQDVTAQDISKAVLLLRRGKDRYTTHPTRPELAGGLAPATLLGYVQSIKTFFNWCYKGGFTSSNLAVHIKRPSYDVISHNRKMTQADFKAMYKLAISWADSGELLKIRTACMFFFV